MDVMRWLLCCGETEGYKLLDAAHAGDADTVRSILERKPKLARKAQQWGGQTAWHVAARDGHADVLQAMGAVISAIDLATFMSIWHTDLGLTKEDILSNLVQYPDSKGLSALHLACIKGHADAVDVLMKLGANPFAVDSVGRTPLHYAASWGFADCINAVLGHHSGPPKEGWAYVFPNTGETRLVNVQNAAGFTPLHYAVWVGRKQAIQALASYDADLKVVNNQNDFSWIQVGSGNTPLHLAAFGGDMAVVKLLLAAYVQSLAAGAEVMAAGRGQWGNRHTDDVRHFRNRRGWMPYHIAMHKGYEHLAELLHPDIPYTFIFSNDDMAPGSVRMYGPSRLMVIAAKALQQKLVDELAQVETATAAAPKLAVPAAAVTVTAAAAAPVGDMSGYSADAEGQRGIAVIGAPVGTTPAAATEVLPSAASSGAVISPFAARSVCAFGQSSFSAGPSEHTSAAASASAAVPTPVVGTPAGSLATPAAAALPPAAAAAAVAAATAAAAAVEVSPAGTDHTEHSFTNNVQLQSGAAAVASAGAAHGLPVKGSTSNHSSFSGFALMQPQQPGSSAAAAAAGSNDASGWQQRDNASVSDAGLSSSTIAPSNAAVAGSAPGSVSLRPISRDGSSHKPPQSMLLSSTGQLVTAVEASSATRSVQWAHLQSSSNASSSQQQQQDGRHRRVPSATAAGMYSRQGSRGLSDTVAGVRGNDDQQPSRFPWGRMESLKRRNSKKDFLELLPPSAVQTSAEDDTESAVNRSRQQYNNTNSSRRSSQETAANSISSPPVRRISSLPTGMGGRSAAAAAAAVAALEGAAAQQPQRTSFDTALHHPVHENPLNVVLAARADLIGDNPEAIRRQLLAMKLASGALQFDNAVSTFTTSLGMPGESERAVSRFASFSHAMPASGRSSINSRAGVTGTVSPAAYAYAAGPDSTAAVVEAAAAAVAAAAALPRIGSLNGEQPASPFAAPQEQQQVAAGDAQQQQSTLSPSPSLFNITAANVIAAQSSQSLQRLLSGNCRGRRAGSVQHPRQQQSTSSIPSIGAAAAGSCELHSAAASLNSSPMVPTAAAAAAARSPSPGGDLPIVQLQPAGAVAAMTIEGDDSDEEDMCEICFDAAAVVALEQCGHTLCVSCCKELCKLHHFKPGLCPYCRQIICGFSRATQTFIP